MFSKKKLLGFADKPRTADEINNEYNQHALNMGHKLRLLADLEDEVGDHKEAMHRLCDESKALPHPAPPVVTPKAAAEAPV